MDRKTFCLTLLIFCLVSCHKNQQPTTPLFKKYSTTTEIERLICRTAQTICIAQLGSIYQEYGVKIDCQGQEIVYDYNGLVRFQCAHPKSSFAILREKEPSKYQLAIAKVCQNMRQRCQELAQLGEKELVMEDFDQIIKCWGEQIIIQPYRRRYGHQVICLSQQLALVSP